MWRGWLGFNYTHSFGVLALCFVASEARAGGALAAHPWAQAGLVPAAAAALHVAALRFFPGGVKVITGIGAAGFLLGWMHGQ